MAEIYAFCMSYASWQLHWRNAQQSDEHVDSSGLVMYYRDSGYNGAATATYRPLYPTNGSASATYRPLSPANGSATTTYRPLYPTNGAATTTYRPLYPTNGAASATYRPLSATTAKLMAAVHLLALIGVAKLN